MKKWLLLLMLLACLPLHATDSGIGYFGAGALGSATTTTDAQAAPPASTVAGQVAFIYAWTRSTSNTTTISGYTEIGQKDTTTGDHRLFWKRLTGTSGTETCDHDTSADNYCQMFVFNGVVASGNPYNVLGTFQSTGTEPFAMTGVTPASAFSMITVFGGYEDDDLASFTSVAASAPVNYVPVYNESGTGADGSIELAYAWQGVAGASGNITWDFNGALSDQLATFPIALTPAASTELVRVVNSWGAGADGSSTTLTLSVTPTGGTGHHLIAIGKGGSTPSSITIADNSGSNTWNATSALVGLGTNLQRMYDSANVAAGTYTITVTYGSSSAFRRLTVLEISNAASASYVDTTTTAQNTTATTVTTGNFSTTNANDMIIAMGSISTVGVTFTPQAIAGTTSTMVGPNSDLLVTQIRSVTATQTNVTATITGSASGNVTLSVVAIKAGITAATGQAGIFIPGP